MDFQRLIIFAALSFTILMIWEAWQNDYVRPKQSIEAVATAANHAGQDLPGLPRDLSGSDMPETMADDKDVPLKKL